ncbi:glycosyl transferase, family 2 [gut metagenome]|uniref:Glycosyl transferase, family 2 n=1 Tax=gut metagenome TaxID=749906 RepID=J9GGT9_9ZZZZ
MMASATLANDNRPSFSLIIPVFNRAQTLPRLFASLAALRYPLLEVILVDNLSTDDSYERCFRFQKEQAARGGFPVILEQESRKGACACRNRGVSRATGDFLFFFDSDDAISADYFETIAPQLAAVDLICTPTTLVLADGTRRTKTFVASGAPYDQILAASLSTQAFTVRTAFLKQAGLWDENLMRWNDWELGIRLLCARPRWKWLTERPFHQIYQHAESISGKSFHADEAVLLQSLKQVERDIENSPLPLPVKMKSRHALYAKCLLLQGHIYKEGEKPSDILRQFAHDLHPHGLFKLCAALILVLDRHRCPGAWRAYLWLTRHLAR